MAAFLLDSLGEQSELFRTPELKDVAAEVEDTLIRIIAEAAR